MISRRRSEGSPATDEVSTIYVNIGNNDAIEGFRDPTSDDPDLVRYRPAEGERVTNIVFPEGMSLNEAFSTTLAALEHHMAQGATPTSIESDSDGLASLLREHWSLPASATPSKSKK